jgi:hypothetical protein
VLERIAAAAETEFQMKNKIAGANAAFNDAVINGDTAVDANGFDGLSKALTGSATELGATTGTDWSAIAAGNDTSFAALDVVDELIHLLNGPATALLGNTKLLSKLRGVARRAGMYTSDPVVINENDPNGTILVEQFGNVVLVDMGTKAGRPPTSSRSPTRPSTPSVSGRQLHRPLRDPPRPRRLPRRLDGRPAAHQLLAARLHHGRRRQDR